MTYQIIYADPPWHYRDKALAGMRGAECKYPVMKLEDLCRLPISALAADDCALFMWATMPKLNEAFPLMAAWGFEYKTAAFAWVKRNRKNQLSWFWGMGRWTRANAELCLLGVKGKPKRIDAGVHSLIESRIERHSKKPDETRDRIVRLLGDIPRVELFARERTPGWHVWGNEVESDIELARPENNQLGTHSGQVEKEVRGDGNNALRTPYQPSLWRGELLRIRPPIQAPLHHYAGRT